MGNLFFVIVFTSAVGLCSQTVFRPADIFSRLGDDVVEGDTVKIHCAISKTNGTKEREFHVYLLKDGLGIKMDIQTGSKNAIFTLGHIASNDSGRYSCVYSIPRHTLNELIDTSEDSIFIHVKDFGKAKTFIRKSFVSEGDHVDVKCSGVENSKRQKALQMYLCKNGIGVSVLVAQGSSEVTFTLQQVRAEDSGHYSCVYSIRKHLLDAVRCTSEESVSLQVEAVHSIPVDPSISPGSAVPFSSVLFFILILASILVLAAVCLLRNFKRQQSRDRNTEPIYQNVPLRQRGGDAQPQNDTLYANTLREDEDGHVQ